MLKDAVIDVEKMKAEELLPEDGNKKNATTLKFNPIHYGLWVLQIRNTLTTLWFAVCADRLSLSFILLSMFKGLWSLTL